MPAPASPLFPMFRSQLQADVATEVFLSEHGLTSADLVRILGADPKNVSLTVRGLVDAGIFNSTQVGRSKVLTPNDKAPFYAPLAQLLTIVNGPPHVLKDILDGCRDVVGAYIYGSWARRAHGIAGSAPRDIDVLILSEKRLGRHERRAVLEALRPAEQRLRRPVNPVFATVDQWRTSDDTFVSEIRSGELVEVLEAPEVVAV